VSRIGVRQARTAARVVMLGAFAALTGGSAGVGQPAVQGLTIVPVTIELLPGQRTSVLTIQNHTDRETDFQVRPFAWSQPGGQEQLTPTDALLVSPPLGRIAVGAGQVVRLVLRQPPAAQELTYRILLDQVPPPPEPGSISFALRISIPVFAEPATHVVSHVRWSLQSEGGANYLVAVNSGGRHDVVRDMALTAADGRRLALEAHVSPYILAGATRRWRIITPSVGPLREPLRLRAHADTGEIDQAVSAPSASP
jgi:fimbrial chaperone protein